MQSRIEAIREAGAQVLAISVDPVETSRELSGAAGLEYPLLSDPALEVIDSYGVRHDGGAIGGANIARPAVFVLDREGRVAWKDLTDNWRVRVRPERILERLRDLP